MDGYTCKQAHAYLYTYTVQLIEYLVYLLVQCNVLTVCVCARTRAPVRLHKHVVCADTYCVQVILEAGRGCHTTGAEVVL